MDRYEQRAAARAAGSATWPRGRRPGPAEQQRDVRAAAAAAARAAAKLDDALAVPALAPQPDRPPKANTTDLASRIMPLKKGGYDQLYNLPALAGRRQVIFAIGTHPSTTGTTAMHPLLAAAGANRPPPASRSGSARQRLTPGTHPRTTSPPAATPSCTSPSPANRPRRGNPAARPRCPPSPAGRP